MTMEQSELCVLANMVNYPERAFDLLGRLGIGAEDFSAGPRREAFAALVAKGAAGVKDGKLDMDHIRWFFSKLLARSGSSGRFTAN